MVCICFAVESFYPVLPAITGIYFELQEAACIDFVLFFWIFCVQSSVTKSLFFFTSRKVQKTKFLLIFVWNIFKSFPALDNFLLSTLFL